MNLFSFLYCGSLFGELGLSSNFPFFVNLDSHQLFRVWLELVFRHGGSKTSLNGDLKARRLVGIEPVLDSLHKNNDENRIKKLENV